MAKIYATVKRELKLLLNREKEGFICSECGAISKVVTGFICPYCGKSASFRATGRPRDKSRVP